MCTYMGGGGGMLFLHTLPKIGLNIFVSVCVTARERFPFSLSFFQKETMGGGGGGVTEQCSCTPCLRLDQHF